MQRASLNFLDRDNSAVHSAFAWLWAIGDLLIFCKTVDLVEKPIAVLLTVPALLVLLRPKSFPRFLLLMCAQIFSVIIAMPDGADVSMLVLLVDVTFIVVFLTNLKSENIFDLAIPFVRLQAALVYFFALLSQFNRDFLSADTSCATSFYREMSAAFGGLLPVNPVTDGMVIVSTLLMNALIPFLLLGQRTRMFGVTFALLFHFVLGIFEFYALSALMLALLVVFVPEFAAVFVGWGRTALRYLRQRTGQSRLVSRMVGALNGKNERWEAVLILLAALGLILLGFAPSIADLFGMVVFSLVSGGLIALLMGAAILKLNLPAVEYRTVFSQTGATFMVIALMILNGTSPYLGLKTVGAFSMYSNLRTEGDAGNHFFLGPELQIFGYQRTPFEILESNDPILTAVAASGDLVVPLELRRYMHDRDEGEQQSLQLTYRQAGEEKTYSPGGEDQLDVPLTFWERNLLKFRLIRGLDASECLR